MPEDKNNIPQPQPQPSDSSALHKVYDYMSKDYDMGTFDDFAKSMQDKSKRWKLYDYMSNTFDMGSFKDFSQRIPLGCRLGSIVAISSDISERNG